MISFEDSLMHVATNVISWTHHWSTKSLDLNLHIPKIACTWSLPALFLALRPVFKQPLSVSFGRWHRNGPWWYWTTFQKSRVLRVMLFVFFGWMGTCIFRLPHAQNEKRKTTTKNEDKAMLSRDLWDEQGMRNSFWTVLNFDIYIYMHN